MSIVIHADAGNSGTGRTDARGVVPIHRVAACSADGSPVERNLNSSTGRRQTGRIRECGGGG